MSKSANKAARKREANLPASQMKSFRFRRETIEALRELTQAVNQNTNIKISSTAILELLIQDAAKGDIERVLRLLHVNKSQIK
jgi:hypothetical protein